MMDIIGQKITVEMEGFSDIKDITDHLRQFVLDSDFSEGLIHIFPIGSTASISTIEFEPA